MNTQYGRGRLSNDQACLNEHTTDHELAYRQPQEEMPYYLLLPERSNGKIAVLPRDNKDILRLLLAVVAMLMLLPFSVLFTIFLPNPTSWLSLSVVSLTIFLIALVAISKIGKS
ncbi:hypothetical protein EPA93_02100 [Ktedonosporobacter rubrisoli]|uniref:Uncharacterized protein n=1 Tax=Ktedonosporobacter rubrisoli TaxID=2509675 RepID=A0A4P6JIW0_KTERU|nr:hypothetical protein [Ktedonosporobacter rubrisoli]QBD74850.1 hypothetical protein EPA93_02100 [Ktedonosporobacter rubrisoli]